MKLLLVNPFPIENEERKIHHGQKFFHYALGVIASSVEDFVDVEILDCEVDGVTSLKDFKNYIEKTKPDVVGFGAFTIQIHDADILAGIAKSIDKNILTIVGGAHPTALPIETMKEFQNFDIAVVGEGVETIKEIIQSLKGERRIEEIKGIVFRKNEEIIYTGKRPLLPLDKIPFPKVELFKNIDKYTGYLPRSGKREFLTYFSLGCPYRCIFCFKQYGEIVRYRSVQRTIQEIEHYVNDFSADSIYFFDWVFGLNRKRTEALLEEMRKRGLEKRIRWKCFTRVDLEPELIEKMAESGCDFINFGVESGSERILGIINKQITIKRIKETVRCAKKNGIKVELNFIIGHPYETVEDIKKMEELVYELDPDFLNISLLTPLPGTKVWDMALNKIGGISLKRDERLEWNKFGWKTGSILEHSLIGTRKLWWLEAKLYAKFYLRPSKIKNLLLLVNIRSIFFYFLHLIKKLILKA